MAIQLSVDDSSWRANRPIAKNKVERATQRGIREVAEEILRLSQLEVPLDEGTLMKSGNTEQIAFDEAEVGYHTKYAARLHEHPEYNFQNGRKGKYLTDPLERNKRKLVKHIADIIKVSLGGYHV